MKPIIKSIIDLDKYKLYMSQFIFFHYHKTMVSFGFTNRTKTDKAKKILLHIIPYINDQINSVKNLRFTFSELMHLRSQTIVVNNKTIPTFREEYLNHLSYLNLCDITVFNDNNELKIEYQGEWSYTTLWETIILSIVAELYARYIATEKYAHDNKLSESEFHIILKDILDGDDEVLLSKIVKPYEEEAFKRLDAKIEMFKHYPSIKFFEFGTRRRFSAALQEKIILRTLEKFHKTQFLQNSSQFLGTSNEYIAMKHGLKAGGTMAHEMFMGAAALNDDYDDKLVNSTWEFLRLWYEFYGYDLSVCLTDTFGSEWFFKNCPQDIARDFSPREDSAVDIFKYEDDVLDLYRKYNINSHEKVLVHSNGLDKNKVISLEGYRPGLITKVYGIGTDMSCDVGFDFPHVSIVIKLIKVLLPTGRWADAIKLSDNLAKGIGSKDTQNRYKKLFGYINKLTEVQTY